MKYITKRDSRPQQQPTKRVGLSFFDVRSGGKPDFVLENGQLISYDRWKGERVEEMENRVGI